MAIFRQRPNNFQLADIRKLFTRGCFSAVDRGYGGPDIEASKCVLS
jgi:hypothetical protein